VWSDDFLVGVAEIDEQHRRLFDMIGRFYEALSAKAPARQALGELLRGLAEYTQYHFSTEERLMARFEFPRAQAHHEQHDDFVRRVTDMADRFSQGHLLLSLEATAFLRDWLTSHILGNDKQLGRYLTSRGVS
jgi:hemerythrin-like metal-binding protein